MAPLLRRAIFWAIPLGLLAAALALAFRPQAVEADIVVLAPAPLQVTLSEDGLTRVRDVFVVSAPISGRARRSPVHEGDPVTAGETLLAEIEPMEADFLDPRSEAEALMLVETARAAVQLAEAEAEQARAELDFARAEVERMRTLRASNTVAARSLDEAERGFRTRAAALTTAQANIEMRKAQLAAAEARLLRPEAPGTRPPGCPCIPLRSPIDGQVLRVLHESEGVVAAGTALVEIGDPADLEIVADFLSSDAVRIEPGQRVLVDRWGGDAVLEGRVERVEPYGETKVSALGIEEQRVEVAIRLDSPRSDWARLGHGFEVEARVILHRIDAALTVPLTALFRNGEGWQVFRLDAEDRARAAPVTLGARADLAAEVLSGLSEGDRVIRYPHDGIRDGTRIAPR